MDGDGCVNFREFVILMLELQELRGTDDSDFRALWNALCVFDKDGNGFIDGVELIEVLQQVVDGGAPLSTAEVRQLIRKIDKNRDGKIDTRELAYFLIGGLEAASKPGNGGPAEKAFPART